jgi:hypothetical protein
MLTAINVLMLRILENSNKNSAFGSLLQHLLQCPQRVRHCLLYCLAVHTCCDAGTVLPNAAGAVL